MKTNNLTLSALTLALTALMVGCGGGGGDSSGTSTSSSTTSSTTSTVTETVVETETTETVSETVEEVATEVTSTSDLSAPDNFIFKSSYEIAVQVSVSDQYEALSICLLEAGDIEPDYSKCLLQATLDAGAYQGDLLLTNDTDQLATILWDFEDPNNPRIDRWDRELTGDQLSLN